MSHTQAVAQFRNWLAIDHVLFEGGSPKSSILGGEDFKAYYDTKHNLVENCVELLKHQTGNMPGMDAKTADEVVSSARAAAAKALSESAKFMDAPDVKDNIARKLKLEMERDPSVDPAVVADKAVSTAHRRAAIDQLTVAGPLSEASVTSFKDDDRTKLLMEAHKVFRDMLVDIAAAAGESK